VSETAYERVFRLNGEVGAFRITHDDRRDRLRMTVFGGGERAMATLRPAARRMCDLDTDPADLAERFNAHGVLRALWHASPGLRIGSGWDPFETVVSTILGQLVSVTQARALLRQLVEAYGERVAHPVTGAPAYLFPTPRKLVRAGMSKVRTSPARKTAIRAVSALVTRGKLDLSTRPGDINTLRQQLLAIRGIGPWSVEYIAMRGLGDADGFPRTDLFLKRILQQRPDLDLERLKPYRAYAAIYLWKHHRWLMSTDSPGGATGIERSV
jgi:3-methyladenine DNA glycosylase/8-oxoguanine DNA glycosylase